MTLPFSNLTTSCDAAQAAAPRAAASRERVYQAIELSATYGRTDQELEDVTGLTGSTVRPRRGELAAMGRIVKAYHTRPTRAGNRATVWLAAQFAAGQQELLK